MTDRPLTNKQLAFCREYVIDSNGKQAAIRAGYSQNGAEVRASELLTISKVKAELSRIRAGLSKKAEKLKKLRAAGFLRRRYGVTSQARAQMSEEQSGVCAICGNPETAVNRGKARELSIDHNHATGKIRGLLCHKCNMAIGLFMEDIDLLASAISYLINHTEIKLVV